MNDIRISKFMSLVLRHDPGKAGLALDANGWTDFTRLVAACHKRFGASEADILRVIAESDKKRFVIDGDRIRANQGHSVNVDLDLPPADPPAGLYHGTTAAVSASIDEKGLIRGNRHHVHLSADTETARRVAVRRKGPWVIYRIDAAAMAGAGHLFYLSANGVWLTESVPPDYLSEVPDVVWHPERE